MPPPRRYNNFYEISTSKQLSAEAKKLDYFFVDNDWEIEIKGLVETPLKLKVSELIQRVHLEERLYRHRCVEAWAISAPWNGFPLAKLLDMVSPLSTAKYVKFTTYLNSTVTPNQKKLSWYPWPYVEAITIEEARNELAFLTVGAYGKPLGSSNGAPIRLTLPWKYGFKSAKSIRTIEFTSTRPTTFWEAVNFQEYGFWANVNPEKPHRRWSQATERKIIESSYTSVRIDTQKFNGYEEEVGYLYKDYDETVEDLWH